MAEIKNATLVAYPLGVACGSGASKPDEFAVYHKWIGVDTKPLSKQEILIYMVILYPTFKLGYYDDGRFYTSGDNEHITKWVTHWMPLPEPPK